MSLFAGEKAQEEGDNGVGRSHRRGWGRRERGGHPPGQPGQKTLSKGETRCFIFGPGIKVVCVYSRKHRKRKKGRPGASHCPTSSKGRWAAGKWSLLEPWLRQRGRNPSQRATPRAGSLGRGQDRRAHSGPAHNRALVGGGGRVLRELLIPRQECASLPPYNLGDGRRKD